MATKKPAKKSARPTKKQTKDVHEYAIPAGWMSEPLRADSPEPKPPPQAWQRACDDIVASAVYFVIRRDTSRLLYHSREVIAQYSKINKAARSHERAARSTVRACMELARNGFSDKSHSKTCRCRAYAILAVNAQNACAEDPVKAQALFLDAKSRFDTYIDQRN